METCYRSRKKDGDYLVKSRARHFGGSTNHWMGWCMKFDPIDLEARDWVPRSGWPIKWADLNAHYPQAEEMLDLPPWEPTENPWTE